jgi:hypothetical protein
MLQEIRQKIATDQFEFSQHAVDQSLQRRIVLEELRQAVMVAEIIEDYPDDKYGPSCLLLGFTESRRPLHFQCNYPSRPLLKIITVYEPDPAQWMNFRVRK